MNLNNEGFKVQR